MASFGATFSAPDQAKLLEALVNAAPYARGLPRRMRKGFKVLDAAPDWRQRLLEDSDGFSVDWGDDARIAHNPDAVAADFPDVALDSSAVLAFVATLPFEVAVLPIVKDYWPENDYYAPAIGADHALLGWGMIFKGAGHERSVVSRRWLEHGPFRTLRGPHDTTLVQFHDLAADGPTSLAQAQPAHEWMVAGFVRPKHRYKHDIAGVYTAEDRLLRVVVNDRDVSDQELLDACAARRDGRADPAKPIENVAYVFVDPAAAKAKLEALWLRGLECRVVEPRGERRIDVDYQPRLAKPAWVTQLG